MSIVCSANGVSFSIGKTQLLKDVSVQLMPGKITAVLGPNGAGKSTLLRALTGELKPSAGLVTYGNQDVRSLKAWELALRRAVMSQNVELTFPFRVDEIIDMGADGLRVPITRSVRQEIVNQCARIADVAHLGERLYPTLSGGERQRVQFARTLVQIECMKEFVESPVLFLDEPVASLDLFHQWQLLNAVRSVVKDGVSAFVVMHDINLAIVYADEVLMMKDGCVIAQGAPETVITPEALKAVFSIVPVRGSANRPTDAVVPQFFRAALKEWVC